MFVSDDDSVNLWVASQLARKFDSTDMLRVKWWTDNSLGKKLRKFLKNPRKIFSYAYLGLRMKLWDTQRDRRSEELLWKLTEKEDSGYSPNIIEVAGKDFNNPENAERIRSINPDLMVVCGGPILRESIFSIPRLGTLNIHFGITPFYRGNHTILWPLFHDDFEKIGATIHQIDHGVDTGEVFAQIYPEIKPNDDEFSIEMKIAKLVADTMTDLLNFVQNHPSEKPLSGVELHGEGVQIFTKDLTLWVEAKYKLRQLLGSAKTPCLAERRELFFLDHQRVLSEENPNVEQTQASSPDIIACS